MKAEKAGGLGGTRTGLTEGGMSGKRTGSAAPKKAAAKKTAKKR